MNSKIFLKISIPKLLFALSMCLFMIIFLYKWHNEAINLNYTQNVYSCIYSSLYKKYLLIDDFEINYIENSPSNCINPNFPTIHISYKSIEKNCNAWIHIIHTDAISLNDNKCVFIDSNKNLYPFYTFDKDFYDAPHWNYSLYKKPLTYWKGHAYAVQLDKNKNIVQIFGGIEWGFRLSWFSILPQALVPRKLTQQEQNHDLDIYLQDLFKYNQ